MSVKGRPAGSTPLRKKTVTTPSMIKAVPKPDHTLRCPRGEARNQPRRTTSLYIEPCTEDKVEAKVFFRRDKAMGEPEAKMPSSRISSYAASARASFGGTVCVSNQSARPRDFLVSVIVR